MSGDLDVNLKKIEKNIEADYIKINIVQNTSFDNMAKIYPNSLLSKFDEKFSKEPKQIEQRAKDIGIEAILRSKK